MTELYMGKKEGEKTHKLHREQNAPDLIFVESA